jgi:hypothetical protein
MVIEAGEMPRIRGRGRPKGVGPNLALLNKLQDDGKPLWHVPRKKMLSIRQSARGAGIKIRVRAIPDGSKPSDMTYAIQRIK